MKKTISILMAILLTASCCAALAQTEATPLPCGVTFGMNMDEVGTALGSAAERTDDEIDDEVGSYYLETGKGAVGALDCLDMTFEINRNNSAGAPRLSMIFCGLPVGDNVIASFREAVAAFTSVYGAPDGDPFDQGGVEGYTEYGYLSATWTRQDVRINVDMSRPYGDRIDCNFSYRLNYDEADLK